MRQGIVTQEPMVANEADRPECVNIKVLSAISDSCSYVKVIVYHSVTRILLETGAAVCLLNEGTRRNSGLVTKIEPVIGTMTTFKWNLELSML